jgi:hypothetical protein
MKSPADDTASNPSRDPGPAIETRQEGPLLWWQVGGRRVEMSPTEEGWEARVRNPHWGDVTLKVDGRFATADEARAWCVRMAAVFAADAEDEAAG